ncbi:hypothetical protein Dda_9084 [Drechslerella dactyloides]|uniref:SH3 domain-containing protein n=1 Tax=Drechslerella dactyloides TaxID=74499 RepID=A0AAD6IQZ8_DREDA|nr:hypothetical protein Dda_9084 [Drechslerella dactyloides]
MPTLFELNIQILDLGLPSISLPRLPTMRPATRSESGTLQSPVWTRTIREDESGDVVRSGYWSFSSGPTGAASEFHEVKSQLASLGVVLEALAKETGRPGRGVEDVRNKEKLGEMVDGCRASLHRLESIVEKYTDKLESSWSWKIWFSKGYKLILWTSDGGDIKALREDLHRHYVMIDSYINVLNRADLQQALDVLERMLDEKSHRRSVSIGSRQHHPNSVLRPDATHISSSSKPKTFEGFPPFFASSDLGYRRAAKAKMGFSVSLRNPMTSVCRDATVNPNFFLGGSIISNQPLFCCNCRRIMKGVLQDSHQAALAKIKCGPGTIIVKNESSDLMMREYTLYAPRIDDVEAKNEDNPDGRAYIISIPLRKNQRLFEASLVQFLSKQAARCLADSVIPESKWVRWENDVAVVASDDSAKNDLYNAWSPGRGARDRGRSSQSKATRGRVLVACSVRLGITAESTIKTMNIKYLPPNNSSWSDTIPVRSVMIIQYRSIRKQKLYNPDEDDVSAWHDGDYLKLHLDFAKVSEYLKETKSLRCDFVWEEKLRVVGPAVTFKVRNLRHFEDDLPMEGAGTLTYLGERLTLTAGEGSSFVQLDRWNLPKVPANRKAVTNEAASLVEWTQPLHDQLRSFWAARMSRKEEIKATFLLNNITIRGRPEVFGQEFYSSQLVVLHDKSTRSTRQVVRSASGTCVITQDVSDRRATKIDLQEDTLSIDEPMAIITSLVPGREKDGPCLKIRQEPNTINYQFSTEQEERQFEEIMANLLRMKTATNLAIVGMRSNPELISVHIEDVDTISILSAFGNIEISPSADMRIDGHWKYLSKSVKEVSISQHRIVRRRDLADRLTQDPSRHTNLFEDSGRSMLQFKCGEKNFTCYIRMAPKLHAQHDYVTLTMEVEDAVLLLDNALEYGSAEERLGSGRLRLRFDGASKATKLVASQSFGWFSFWRNRLNMRRWFEIDEDEEKEYESGIEEAEVENQNPRFFEGFFNNSTLTLLKNDEMNTIRILVRSFSNNRILSQYVLPSHFTREGSVRASIDACCIGERTLVLTHDSAVAEQSEDGDPRCWRLSGAASYMFPTKQMRDMFCDNLARVITAIARGPGDVDDGIFELDSSSLVSPNAVELPTFEFSMPTLLRRATVTHKITVEADENDFDSEPEPEGAHSQYQSPRSSNLGLSEPRQMIRPSRSFVRERRLSAAPTPELENLSRRTTPSPKPALFIPPPPPLPSFPKELTASPVETRNQPSISSPPKPLDSPIEINESPTIVNSPRSTNSSRTFVHSRSPSRSTNTTYRVWAHYDAKEDSEINVKVGDMIKVDYEDDEADAVWGVKMHSKPRLEGWVPKWCLTQVGNLDFNLKARRRHQNDTEE